MGILACMMIEQGVFTNVHQITWDPQPGLEMFIYLPAANIFMLGSLIKYKLSTWIVWETAIEDLSSEE